MVGHEFHGPRKIVSGLRALKSSRSKRQVPLMITACASEKDRVEPLIIFHGDYD